MSKNKRHDHVQPKQNDHLSASLGGEYRIIRSDLIRLLVLNVIYLAIIIGVYITNNQSHYLEHWFTKFIHI